MHTNLANSTLCFEVLPVALLFGTSKNKVCLPALPVLPAQPVPDQLSMAIVITLTEKGLPLRWRPPAVTCSTPRPAAGAV
jgi:hypothetical protein